MTVGVDDGSCTQVEVRVNGEIAPFVGGAGLYYKQNYTSNGRSVYIRRSYKKNLKMLRDDDRSLKYNTQTSSWEVK